MIRSASVLVVAALSACGGSVVGTSHNGPTGGTSSSSAGADGLAGGAGADPALSGRGGGGADALGIAGEGATAAAGDSDSAGSAGESRAVAARRKSGRALCLDDRDCNGLVCTDSAGRTSKACFAHCESAADCKRSERCFEPPSFPDDPAFSGIPDKLCVESCELDPVVCAFQFDCADYYRVDDYVCLPSEWIRRWPVPIE